MVVMCPHSLLLTKDEEQLTTKDALVLVTDATLDNVDEMLPILEVVARDGRPLVPL